MTVQERAAERTRERSGDNTWKAAAGAIHIGKDVLELLSSSMYVDPMTIYREYVQNAADSLDQAVEIGTTRRDSARVEISVDPSARTIRIRDNGTGIPTKEFVSRLCSIGASTKRGTAARGFRGVGRLAGLGYCQELIFRSRAKGDNGVSEMRWDCRELKSGLRATDAKSDISALIKSIVAVREIPGSSYPNHFFEVELRGVIRHRNDRLLNPTEVQRYLSQVAPVPFAPGFRFGEKIHAALEGHVNLGNVEIFLNESERPLYRPHRNKVSTREDELDRFEDLELHTITGNDGEPAALMWVAHHGYSGALPNDGLIKGIRFRVGNVQVGDNTLVEELFPEPRFNAWAVGEVHVFDKRVVPNGRRDHFEQNIHYDNVLNQLGPIIRDISKRCRHSSIARKWLREFDLLAQRAATEARSTRRRVISDDERARHAREADKALEAMEAITSNRYLDDPTKEDLIRRCSITRHDVEAILRNSRPSADPFAVLKPSSRRVYREVLGLIYEVMPNPSQAESLVDKLLDKLATHQPRGNKSAKNRKRGR